MGGLRRSRRRGGDVLFPLLKAICTAAMLTGLLMIGFGWYGDPAGTQSRGRKVRATGAATAARARAIRFGSGAVVSLLVWLVSGWPVAGVAVMALWVMVPYFFGAAKVAARRISRLEGLDEWTRRMAEVIAAGLAPIPTIVESAERAPLAIRPEVSRLATKLATPRLDRQQALREFADELDDQVSDLITVALGIAVGSSVSEKVPDVLRTMAEGVSEDVRARRDIEVKRAGPRSEARLMLIVVIVMVVGFSLATEYDAPYNSVLGQLVMAVLAALMILALFLLRWFSAGSPPPRILPPENQS